MNELPGSVSRPAYDRTAQQAGIVHFGIGAFHRAHQAVYTDDAMNAGERDWGIVGVSLRSPGVASQLNPQRGLYTVTERSSEKGVTRVIGSVDRVLVAGDGQRPIIDVLAAPSTHVVSFTITEKGYCRAPDGSLDFSQAGGRSVYGLLASALAARQAANLPGLSLLSCDNLAGNGPQLQRLMTEYLDRQSPALRRWFETECTCPATMVDRIVPATTPAERAEVQAAIGCVDEAAVITEPFCQWVIEDRFAGPRPRWEIGGAQLTGNVQPFETAKLRMLNGAHSALAYLGLARGYRFVHQAIGDPMLGALIDQLMRKEAAPSIGTDGSQDLDAYADALIARFHNSALNHRLAQIAMDGSQKIPQRWLETLAWNQARGNHCPAIMTALAAWLLYVRGDGGQVDDPRAAELAAASASGIEAAIAAILGPGGLLGAVWLPDAWDREMLIRLAGNSLAWRQ